MLQQAAGVILFFIDDNQKKLYLLLQHSQGNHWGFPKGRIEPHELSIHAALRELKEETGIEGIIHDTHEWKTHYSFTIPDNIIIDKTVVYYPAQTTSTNVILSHEHNNYAWLEYNQALERLTHARDQKILTLAHDYLNKPL